MGEAIKIFIAGSCQPCQEIKELVKDGRFDDGEQVEMFDLETEEGFPYLEKLGLSKVPCAFKGKKQCQIQIDDANKLLVINCPPEEEPKP